MEASAAPGHSQRIRPAPLSGRLLRLASDERLVEHVRAGSEQAFEVVFDRHHRGVLSFCRHMLSDAQEAEDAVQHTFMAAYRDLVGSEKAINLKPWLYTIARNRCLSILRGRRERPSDELEEISTDNLAAEVQRRQDLQDMLRDLAGLPEEQRAALVLSEIGDVSHEEIAGVLGCQREKVKALVFQARSSLSASRQARDTSCVEIREQLATLRGGSLRRNTLRRHLKECDGCRAFAEEVKGQRKAMAMILPVVPTLGLKESALAAAFGSGGAGAAATAGAGAAAGAAATSAGSAGATALAAKALVVVAIAGGGGAAGVNAISGDEPSRSGVTPEHSATPEPGGPAPAAMGGQETAERAKSGDTPIKRRVRKNKKDGKGKANGHDKGKANGLALGHDEAAKAERKAEREAAREERRSQRTNRGKRKAKGKDRTRVRPQRTPDPKPKPTPTPRPRPTASPDPTPTPTPTPTAEPSPQPGDKASGGGLGNSG